MGTNVCIDAKTIRNFRIAAIACAILFFAITAFFCIFYLFSSYHYLQHWYFGLNSCFYRNSEFTTLFFTESVKKTGNFYCIGACVLALSFIYGLTKKAKQNYLGDQIINIHINPYNYIGIIGLITLCAVLWQLGNKNALPAFDEVFSANNIAGTHPFQGVSYYMLPNNHLLYNLVNNILFPNSFDKVLTGRLLSFVAYSLFTLGIYGVARHFKQSIVIAMLIAVLMASQFFVWGFGFQARGYEWYLLAEGATTASLFGYMLYEKKYWLYINTLACVAGYFIMPSFLYFHAAQLLFCTSYCIITKKACIALWKYQVIIFLLAFIMYLPVLTFSGVQSITSNHYVAPMGTYNTKMDFVHFMFPYLKSYLPHVFSTHLINNIYLDLTLLLAPFSLLLFRKNKPVFILGLFYAMVLITFCFLAIMMKRLPFERNLLGHYSLALMGCIVVFMLIMNYLPFKNGYIKSVIICSIIVMVNMHFLRTNLQLLQDTLYENNTNYAYNLFNDKVKMLPANSVVALSDEAFYYGYMCKKNGCTVNKCLKGNEDYYLSQTFESLPLEIDKKFVLIDSVNEMKIYRKRK